MIEFRRQRKKISSFSEGLEIAEIEISFSGAVHSESGMVVNLKLVDLFIDQLFAHSEHLDFSSAVKISKFYEDAVSEFSFQFASSGVVVSRVEVFQPRKNATFCCYGLSGLSKLTTETHLKKLFFSKAASEWVSVCLCFSGLIVPIDPHAMGSQIESTVDLEKINGLVRFSVQESNLNSQLISCSTHYS